MRDYQRSHRLLCQLFGVTPLVLIGNPLAYCSIFLSPSHLLIFHLPVSNINSISCWKLICTNAKEVQLLKRKNRKEKRQQLKYPTHRGQDGTPALYHNTGCANRKWVLVNESPVKAESFFAQILTFLFSGLKHVQRMNMDDFPLVSTGL